MCAQVYFDVARDTVNKMAIALMHGGPTPLEPEPEPEPHADTLHQHPCMDITEDGVIGVDDLLGLLAAFGGPVAALHVFDGHPHAPTIGAVDILLLLPDYGHDISGGCIAPIIGDASTYLDAVVTVAAASATGYTTYTLTASLHGTAANLYSIEGTADGRMEIPPAFQVAVPFGVDCGGVNPAFFAIMPDSQYDSWLSVGVTDGTVGELTTLGVDFAAWTESAGLSVDNGAVFWMHPSAAPGGDVVVAQLTVRSGSSGAVTMGMQGHSTSGPDWDVHHAVFAYP